MNQLDADLNRRETGNAAGKSFRPMRFGPRPIPSSCFSYDHNTCKPWFDRWLMRGGTSARDTVYIQRANDMPDLRTFDLKVRWFKTQAKLRPIRLRIDVRRAIRNTGKVVPFKRP